MRINPPGKPQQHDGQPEIHTFIGDTPQVPDKAALEITDLSFSAVRAYQHSAHQSTGLSADSTDNDDFDVRKASPREQARWLAADERLSH